MDPLNETTYIPQLMPLLTWIKVIEVCAGILLVLALVTLLATLVWRLSWRIGLSALVPLAAGIAAHALHSRYVSWTNSVLFIPHSAPGYADPQFFADTRRFFQPFEEHFTSDMHTATILGWVFVVVTGMLVALDLLGTWRLVADRRQRESPISVASEP